jgi:ribosomal protein L24E
LVKKLTKIARGLTIFTFDGRAVHFCSSKCRRNSALGRDAKKLNWTKKNILHESFEEENNSETK